MIKGIVYKVWGERAIKDAERSSISALKKGYQTQICVMAEDRHHIDEACFDVVTPMAMEPKRGMMEKPIGLIEKCAWDVACYLDCDTTVCGKIDYGFAQAERYGIAICMAPYSNLRYVENYGGDVDLPQYNCGVIFFNRKMIRSVWIDYECACMANRYGMDNDQPYLSEALRNHCMNPVVLPSNYNFRNKWQIIHGELKIWHTRKPLPSKRIYESPTMSPI